ncbi:hypothetical protein [Paludisphaera mucosa]|uniref:Uncharacterized protein n=1 Tax=Paludisphaera mucosa TaxID=3030827 RepID=A0ABT6F559_9BACT|nr:hypothetical protein [Paludisphaera mucosa]MDG3002716.1 hypothetical protein [Paludisphaera mucosa]
MKHLYDERRLMGYLVLSAGIGLMFLIIGGGGFLAATNAAYWCGVLLTSFLAGLAFPGTWLAYQAGRNTAASSTSPTVGRDRWSWSEAGRGLLFGSLQAAMFVAALAYFRSAFFATDPGRYLFVIPMGIACGSLTMLGAGILVATAGKPATDDRLL